VGHVPWEPEAERRRVLSGRRVPDRKYLVGAFFRDELLKLLEPADRPTTTIQPSSELPAPNKP
jgi:hypothetical protein